jgi:hypothetical protein
MEVASIKFRFLSITFVLLGVFLPVFFQFLLNDSFFKTFSFQKFPFSKSFFRIPAFPHFSFFATISKKRIEVVEFFRE